MKGKLIHHLSAHNLTVEEFDKAIYCNGIVYPWKREYITVFSGSRCWGQPVYATPGCYTRTNGGTGLSYNAAECCYTLDSDGMYVDIIRVSQQDPLQLECTEYVCIEEGDDPVYRSLENDFLFHREDDHIIIDGYSGDPEVILVPPTICGYPVSSVSLGLNCLTDQCRTLIISEGISLVSLNFDHARHLKRLEFPASAQLTVSPKSLQYTDWFHRQEHKPVYLGGYYIGTPGGGSGSDSELVVEEGTKHIADSADFHCFWHRIVLPDSIESIGSYAFADGKCLEHVRLPEKVRHIADGAFMCCPRLKALYLPDVVCRINAFHLCYALEEVSVPAACEEEAAETFFRCPRILVRDNDRTRILEKNVSPEPVIGILNGYFPHSCISAAGNCYPSTSHLTEKRRSGPDDYFDCYGNPVKKVIITDPQLYTNSGEIYSAPYWYLYGPYGLTQVTFDAISDAYLVWDGIPEAEIPPEARTALSNFPRISEPSHKK